MKRLYAAFVLLLCSTVAFGQAAPSCLAPFQRLLFNYPTGPGDFDGGNTAIGWFGYRCYSSTSALDQPWIADVYSLNDQKHTLITCGLGGDVFETVYPLSEVCPLVLGVPQCTVKFMFSQAPGSPAPQMQIVQAQRPTFVPDAMGSGKGCMNFSRAATQNMISFGFGYAANVQVNPVTLNAVAMRNNNAFNTSLQQTITLSSVGPALGFGAAANRIQGGAPFAIAQNGFADGTYHSSFGVFVPGSNSYMRTDGTQSALSFQNANAYNGVLSVGPTNTTDFLDGRICEFGVWQSELTAPQQAAIYADQRVVWGPNLP